MKRSILLVCVSILVSLMFANPWSMSFLSEVWFTDNGHLWLELVANMYITNFNQIQIAHGDNCYQFPFDIPTSYSITNTVIDVNEYFPEMIFDPVCDSVIIKCPIIAGEYFEADRVEWGEDFSNYINSPLPGQSLVKSQSDFFPTYFGEFWFKDEPPTPGDNIYNPVARNVVFILVTTQDGVAIPNFPLYFSDVNIVCGNTNSSGVYVDTLKAGKLHIRLKNPHTNEMLYENNIWLRPNESTFIPIEISYTEIENEALPALIKNDLKAYPTPFNSRETDFITFKYDGDTKLSRDTYIRLYDTKGRFIRQIPMSAKGLTTWKPSSEIGSGHYFARLISGKRILDTTSLTIIK